MKISKQREPSAERTERGSVRGKSVSRTSGGALDTAAADGPVVEHAAVVDSAERAVAALEQRRDAPAVPETVVVQTELTSSVAPVASTVVEAPTQAELAAAIAEGAATPFEELVAGEGMQADSPELEAEQAGKAEPVAETPELDVGPVKRRG